MGLAGGIMSQDATPPPLEGGRSPGVTVAPVAVEAPPPVLYKGEPVDKMTDEQLTTIIQGKVLDDVDVDDGQVMVLRVAPGYHAVLVFKEPISDVIVDDPKLFEVQKVGKKLDIKAATHDYGADAQVKVFFGGDKFRVFHLIIAENFAEGISVVRVNPFGKNIRFADFPGANDSGIDMRRVANVVGNYDAMLAEGQIKANSVERIAVFRKNPATSFTTYYIYRFSDGVVAISFAYQNPFMQKIEYDETRLRIELGGVRYIPDRVYLHKRVLAPGAICSGFAVVARPVFSPKQPFELVWK